MSTAVKGSTTEAAVLKEFAARGFGVFVPFGDGEPLDLVVHLGSGDFLRVQCKTARLTDGCVVFNGRSTDHGRGRLTYRGLADVFGAYLQATDTVYLVPVESHFAPRLRLTPTRNNQKRGIRFAADFEIDAWTIESLREVVREGRSEGVRNLSIA
jgi:hypothetical protein